MLGTVLGLFAIVVLQNGLRLSRQPAELAGILTGVLLLVTDYSESRFLDARTRDDQAANTFE